jgi:PPOX class probable FMN-dependent enzyme
MPDSHRIESVAALREAIPEPSPVIHQKVFDRVDEYARAFIERAPLVLVATSDAQGRIDVSPKGDAPGFVAVEDERTLVLPERPGNKLAYGFRNLLENPHLGLIFLVPGVTETLRVNGRAAISRDPALLERLAARGKPALLATRVAVEECFFHCGKAFIRSKLWDPGSWPQGVRANLGKQMARKLGAGDELANAIEDGLAKDYREGL